MIKLHLKPKKIILLGSTLLIIALCIVSLPIFPKNAKAYTAGFNAGRIIDDTVFTNTATLDAGQIQSFLNSKVPTCDTNGTQPASDFGRPDLTHAQYAAGAGWPGPPYTCLKDYSENGLSAAQIISNTAQQYQINPEVLIVLLQKEQGLVTDTWPLNSQYRTATGYGCPDTAACDTTYYGFTNQVTWAGKMYRAILNQSPTWYSPYVLGNNYVQWNPSSSCGGSTVNIQNLSTVALYDYTPYQPNQASLNAGYGMGDSCSSYGNRNFYNYFTDWFGSTYGGSPFGWQVTSYHIYSDAQRTVDITGDTSTSLQPGQVAYVRITARNTGANSWSDATHLATTSTPVIADSSWPAYNLSQPLNTYPIAYNGVGTFDFAIKAPTQVGVYRQYIKMVDSGTSWFPGSDSVIAVDSNSPISPVPAATAANALVSAQTLTDGNVIFSPEKYSALSLSNGHLDLYVNYKKVWSAPVSRYDGKYLVNQSDGNLVLYTADGQVAWASNTNGQGAGDLEMQSDGNLVLYGSGGSVLWATNTSKNNQLGRINYAIGNDYVVHAGQSLMTVDRRYILVMQPDGNLVLYTSTGRALWASNTDGSGANAFVLQGDGNMVLYTNTGRAVWASNTSQ